ncbi:MAG: DUF4091 domain-containing protein [Planctomycetes bacterium]|nr:DUF4091 domain-containing protein [Planctomycetota bacterium]
MLRFETAFAAFLVGMVLLGLVPGRCTGAENRHFTVWAADPLTKIGPKGKPIVGEPVKGYKDANAVWDGSERTVRIEAARNEYVAFQVLIEGGGQGLEGVNISPSDLKSPDAHISAADFTLFCEYYTRVTTPSKSPAYSLGSGWYPDALIPLDLPKYRSFSVPPARTQGIWVDLHVPADVPAGRYSGEIAVSARDRDPVRIKVALGVWDFVLPAESHLRWRVGYNEALATGNGIPFDRRTSKVTKEFLDLELDFYRLCRRHRIIPTTHYTSPIPDHSGKGGDLKIDWASYDRRFGRYLDGSAFEDGVPVNYFCLPVNPQSYGGWPSSTRGARVRLDTAAPEVPLASGNVDLDSLRKALELTVEHWKEKGWNIEDTFIYVADEPGGQGYHLIKEHARVMQEVAPRVHRNVALYRVFGKNAPDVVKRLRGYVNDWSIAGDYMQRGALEGLRERGDWVGIYQGSAPFEGGEALDMDGVALVTWPWIAWMYELDTLFIYNSTEWKRADIWDNARNQGWQTNSQGVLFYPGLKVGVKHALPSIRLKQMRRGMQDYEYMRLLAEKGKKNLADSIARRIIRKALQDASPGRFGQRYFGKGHWEHNAAHWIEARREMAAAISVSQQDNTGGP